jgi:hypothetical protein
VKIYRNAIILVVVAALLLGTYVVIKNKKDPESAGQDDKIKIFELDMDKMVELTIENDQDKLVFVPETVMEDDEEKMVWKISSPKDLRIDESKISGIADYISSLKAEKIIEEEADDFSIYGLDKPVLVSVKMEDSTLKTLEIGDETPTGNGYYVKVKGEKKVYTITGYVGRTLKASKNDLRDRNLLSIDPEEITEISLKKGESIIFRAKKLGEFEWELTLPIRGNVNTSSVYPMLTAVSDARVVQFIEENPSTSDLDEFGLLNPTYCIEFDTPAGREKLLFGKEQEKGSRIYVKLSSSNEVFAVSLNKFNFLDRPLKDIIGVSAYIVNINDVNRIKVEMDGYTVNCELQTDKDNKENCKFFVNGKDVTNLVDEENYQIFRKYFGALIGVKMSEVKIEAEPSGTPEIVFTYHLKKAPYTMKVEFIPKDNWYYYVMRNGQYTGILVDKKEFDKPGGVREMYKVLQEAMKK